MIKNTILYADDDLDDLFIVEQALAPFAHLVSLVHVTDGGSALAYLQQLRADGREPCMILLDMNMPIVDGRQALMQIRQSPQTKHLPVVVFTTSSSNMDKEFARKWNAHFFTKPVSFIDLRQLADKFISICAGKNERN